MFGSKSQCNICNGKVGLNGHRVIKSKAWCCHDCFEKAGGSRVINLFSITIPEIKKIISEKTNPVDILENDSAGIPHNADALLEFSIKNNYLGGMKSTKALPYFKVIEEKLIQDEKVLLSFFGTHNYETNLKNDLRYAYAVTDERILMSQKHPVKGSIFQELEWDSIDDIFIDDYKLTSVIEFIGNIEITKRSGKRKSDEENISLLKIGFDKYTGNHLYEILVELLDSINS